MIAQKQRLLQGANSEVEEALDDKDEAFEYVTALLDDTLEQADAAVDSAKRALQRGENPATSKVSTPMHVTHVLTRIRFKLESCHKSVG